MDAHTLLTVAAIATLTVLAGRLAKRMYAPDGIPWAAIQPGDIGHDAGVGLVGLLITAGTESSEGHSWIYVRPLGQVPRKLDRLQPRRGWTDPDAAAEWARLEADHRAHRGAELVEGWITMELWATGAAYRIRTRQPISVQRVWRTEVERATILHAAGIDVQAGTKYGYGEIARIVAWRLGLGWRRAVSDPNPSRRICSHSAARAAMAARGELHDYLGGLVPHEAWPGRLSRALAQLEWDDRHAAA